jgi:endo-1,4-beta-xylanase
MNFRVMAAAAASVLALAGTATAADAPSSPPTLRALGAQVHLRIGTAAIPSDLSDPTLSQITSEQFSVLTPGNEMKWQVVEPEQGNFNWTGADNLVNLPRSTVSSCEGTRWCGTTSCRTG